MAGEQAEKASKEWRRQYAEARKKEKTALINEVSRLTTYHQIPIRTDNEDIVEPGYVEIDLVAHCVMNSSGTFGYSLNLTDIYISFLAGCLSVVLWV